MKNNQIKSVRDTYRPIEELQFLLRIEAIPLTETIVKRAVENFIEAAHFIENAPSSAFYDKDIEHFNMYMWRIREHAFDIMNSWLKRHNNAVSQDDLVYKSCVSIIEAIRLVAIETGTPIQPKPDDEIFKQKKEFRDYMVGDNIENRLSKAKKIQAKRKKN